MYAELELEAELSRLMKVLERSDLESEAEMYAPATTGKAVIPRGRCTPNGVRVGSFTDTEHDQVEQFLRVSVASETLRAVVETAAGGAVSLATTAATALDRANRNNSVRATFCEAFGVMPEFVPPWRATLRGVVRWRDLGELVAIRLRDVAKILDGGCIHYFTWVTAAHCPDCGGVDPTNVFACSDFQGRYLICIGGLFWQAWQNGDTVTTRSTLLHESLHIYFRRTVADSGRSGNANCYERFAVRLQNLFLHPATDSNCAAGACALPSPPVTILDQFGFDQAVVPAIHRPLVGRIAQDVVRSWTTAFPVRTIESVGFADSSGSDAYNIALGQRRAEAVQTAIGDAVNGSNPSILPNLRFVAHSQGSHHPIAPSTTAAGRARNRRVEVSLQQA